MRDTMYQEAVLTAIDDIESAQLYSECEVLIALGKSYAKSAMIFQEESTDSDAGTKTTGEFPIDPFTGKAVDPNQKKWYQRVWEVIKTIAGKIKDFFKNLPSILKKFFTQTVPNFFKNLPAKTGMIIAEIKGVGKLTYIGPDGGDTTDAKNFEVTIDFDILAAIVYLDNLMGDGKNFIYEIKHAKIALKKASKMTKINLATFQENVPKITEICDNLTKFCNKRLEYTKDILAEANANEDKASAKTLKKNGIDEITYLLQFVTKLQEKIARVSELIAKSREKFDKKQAKAAEKKASLTPAEKPETTEEG